MIKLQDYTPEIYYKESRDFQLLGHLFDFVLNAVKTDTDLIYSLPISDNSNDKLLDLLAFTLGFAPDHRYNSAQLRAICKVFPEILKNKGSIQAVIIACNALFNAAGLTQSLDYDFTKGMDHIELNLYIPQEFGDITIINNLLTYILPAGLSCNIIRELRIKEEAETEIAVNSIFTLYKNGEYSTDTAYSNHILYTNNLLAKIPQISTEASNRGTKTTNGTINVNDLLRGLIKDNTGFGANGVIYKPDTNNK